MAPCLDVAEKPDAGPACWWSIVHQGRAPARIVLLPQARYEVWTQDALHSAIYANCSATADGAAEALMSFAARQQATPLPPAVELPATGAPAHGQHADVRKALLQCLPADEDKGFEPNAMTSILSQQPAAMRLQSSGQAVTLPPGLGVGDAFAGLNDISSGSTSVLEAADGFYYRYAAEPEGGGASPARPPTLKLRAGAAYDISVQLYDALGYPVVDGKCACVLPTNLRYMRAAAEHQPPVTLTSYLACVRRHHTRGRQPHHRLGSTNHCGNSSGVIICSS